MARGGKQRHEAARRSRNQPKAKAEDFFARRYISMKGPVPGFFRDAGQSFQLESGQLDLINGGIYATFRIV